ncbi:MAG: hypothetical protein K2X27_10415 [Candidatus Obscuribacterales bacterium]|nr:hypothetical protein [Candidatus Obscuribacterales bacterium]
MSEISKFEELDGAKTAPDFEESQLPFDVPKSESPSTSDTSSKHLPGISLDDHSTSFVSADGPGRISDDSLNGQNPRQEPAALGNAHHTVELIERGGFQNKDGSLTEAGAESIRAAIAQAGAFPKIFQTYEGRSREVENYINRHVHPPVSIRFDRDQANADRLTGSRPYIEVTVGGQTSRIPLRR